MCAARAQGVSLNPACGLGPHSTHPAPRLGCVLARPPSSFCCDPPGEQGAVCLLPPGLVHRAVLCTGEKGLPVAVAQAPWVSCTSAGSSAENAWASHCHFSFSPGKGHCLVSSHLIRDHHLCATKSPKCCCIRRLCPCNCKSPKSSCDSCN